NELDRAKAKESKPASSRASQTPKPKRTPLSESPNFVTREERERRRKLGLCIKCGEEGHIFEKCPNGWVAPKKDEKRDEKKDKGKEKARVATVAEEESDIEPESEN
ncbi:hypothetical protein FRC08_010948, partial [Ceratobasidium sp. 394]